MIANLFSIQIYDSGDISGNKNVAIKLSFPVGSFKSMKLRRIYFNSQSWDEVVKYKTHHKMKRKVLLFLNNFLV